MKVFLSWSGSLSQKLANEFANWLPNVVQKAKPFLSTEDIRKGQKWFSVISSELKQTNFGILFITKSNLESPWILFEAGALSKEIEAASVCPYRSPHIG